MSSLNPLRTVGGRSWRRSRHSAAAGEGARADRRSRCSGDVGPARASTIRTSSRAGCASAVMIAMAICTNPDVLVADEPTTALDVTTQARIMELLGRIVEERRMGMILITHDLGLASSFCDDIHVMYAGRIVESGSAEAVLGTPAHPYSEALLESICGLDRDVGRPIAAISGQPPHQAAVGLPLPPALRLRAGDLRRGAAAGGRRPGPGGGVPLPGAGAARERHGRDRLAHGVGPGRRAARRRRPPQSALPPRRASFAAHRQGGRRRLARAQPRRDGRARGRVRLGQVHARAPAAPARRADLGRRPLRLDRPLRRLLARAAAVPARCRSSSRTRMRR